MFASSDNVYCFFLLQVVEIVDRYDDACVPPNVTDKLAYIQNATMPKTCQRTLTVMSLAACFYNPKIWKWKTITTNQHNPWLKYSLIVCCLQVTKDMKQPIFVYYQLNNFYQNHRRYVLCSYLWSPIFQMHWIIGIQQIFGWNIYIQFLQQLLWNEESITFLLALVSESYSG
jgi:hypothetical protein